MQHGIDPDTSVTVAATAGLVDDLPAPGRPADRLRRALRHRSLSLGLAITAVLLLLVLSPALLPLADPDLQDPALAFSFRRPPPST